MPNCTGKSGEIVLVMEEQKWKSNIGDSINDWFSQEYSILPQPEMTFKLVQIPYNAFNDIFKPHRNIIFVYIGENYKTNSVTIETNKWSAPQKVVTMQSPNTTSFLELFAKVRKQIYDSLVIAEIGRFHSNYKTFPMIPIITELRKKHFIDITVPKGYVKDVDLQDFVWISQETPTTSQGILVYYYPYKSVKDFSTDALIRKRDSMLLQHVPGPSEGSYMATERRMPVLRREFTENGVYICELRGLWQVVGDFMGGPFVSRSMVDTLRNRVVTVEGFVYAGKQDKRSFVWQVEAIINSASVIYKSTEK